MKVVIVDENMRIFTTIYDSNVRIPVKGDYLCYKKTQMMGTMSEEPQLGEGIVEKVMIDYAQDGAIVTVKELV